MIKDNFRNPKKQSSKTSLKNKKKYLVPRDKKSMESKIKPQLPNESVTSKYSLFINKPQSSIKLQRHVFSNSLSKEWAKWRQNNPLPEGAVEVLKKYPKPPENYVKKKTVSSTSYSDKSLNIAPRESRNNIQIIKSGKENITTHLSSSTAGTSASKITNSKEIKTKNITVFDSAKIVDPIANKKNKSKKDYTSKYILFNIRPLLKSKQLVYQNPIALHFDNKPLAKEEENLTQPALTLDSFSLIQQKFGKSRARRVYNCCISDDESAINCCDIRKLDANIHFKNNSLPSRKKYSDDLSVEYGGRMEENKVKIEHNDLTVEIKKLKDFLRREKNMYSLKKSRNKRKLHINEKNRGRNLLKNQKHSVKTTLESSTPSVIEYKFPDTCIFVAQHDKEPSVCCIPWIKDKMKRITSEKKKARKQMQKSFPFDKAHCINTDISDVNLVSNLTSIFDATPAINNFMKYYF